MTEIKVGSKGELFLPKSLREQLGFKAGDRLYLEVNKDGLIIRKVPDLLDLLELPPIGPLEDPDEIEKELEEIQASQMDLALED
jgi:AbrB family looped-hinge helix DNA binding protein